jgi:peptidoglycan/LPS O-acetylase OafA/YrhL
MKIENSGVNLLRLLAIVLVINSHMDDFYPFPILGTGGAIGNALFFMLSSYGLMLSEKRQPQRFQDYFFKRIRRIYPTLWTFVLILIVPILIFYHFTSVELFSVVAAEFNIYNPLGFLGIIFYPPAVFWFLQALMLFYVFGFAIIKNYSDRKILYAATLILCIYVILYFRIQSFESLVIEQDVNFKLVFYSSVFLFGIYLASVDQKIKYTGISDFAMLLLFLVVIYGHKLLVLTTAGKFSEFQFIQQLAIFPLVFYFLKISRSGLVENFMNKCEELRGGVTLVAAMTLELYIVHGPLRGLMLPYIGAFPGNVIIYVPTVFVISYFLYRLNKYLIKFAGA